MDDWLLRVIVLGGLGGLFGGLGISILVTAYRTGDLVVWAKLAIVGGVSVLLSAVLAGIAVTRSKDEPHGTQPSMYMPWH